MVLGLVGCSGMRVGRCGLRCGGLLQCGLSSESGQEASEEGSVGGHAGFGASRCWSWRCKDRCVGGRDCCVKGLYVTAAPEDTVPEEQHQNGGVFSKIAQRCFCRVCRARRGLAVAFLRRGEGRAVCACDVGFSQRCVGMMMGLRLR